MGITGISKRRMAYEILLGILSFALPLLLLLVAFASSGFSPFDPDGVTTMMLDQRDQYVAYLRYYQYALQHGGSLIYTMGKVFGGDFMSIFAYYLASPFNLILGLLTPSDIPSFFLFSAVSKLAFGSLNFYLLCRFGFKKAHVGYLAFGVGYALMSYNLIYISNFMYMDVIMALPLVVLGILFLQEGKHLYVYPLALGYCLWCSWYLGAMVCGFSVLFFLTRFFSAKRPYKNQLPFLLRYALFSLLGGLSVAAIWLTAFLHFEGTKASAGMPSHEFFPLTIFFSGLLENSYTGTSDISRNTGYMTMFVGVVGLALSALYPFNKAYSLKERLLGVALFLLLSACTLESKASALWHGGKDPSWFPTRFSFLIGFLLCYFAAKETAEAEHTPKRALLFPLALLGVVLPVVLWTDNHLSKTGPAYYTLSIPSLILYLLTVLCFAVYLFFRKFDQRFEGKIAKLTLGIALVAIGSLSSYRGMASIIEANLKNNAYEASSLYASDCALEPVFNFALSQDGAATSRMEATFNRPGGINVINNNPMFYGYNGLNHYSSSEKKKVSNHMDRLGFHINPFYENYGAGSTQAINSFLGLRYLIDDGTGRGLYEPIFQRNAEHSLYKAVSGCPDSSYTVLKNDLALPLGFATPTKDADYVSQGEYREGKSSVYWYDHFEYQNKLFSTLHDGIKDGSESKAIYKAIPLTSITVPSGVTFTEDEHGIRRYSGSAGKSVEYRFTLPAEAIGKNLYVGVKDTPDKFRFTLDGMQYRINDYFYSGIHGFNDTAIHTHVFRAIFDADISNEELRPEFYYEETDVLAEYLNALNVGGLRNAKTNVGLLHYGIEGEFTRSESDQEFIFTIPYEKQIHVYVDGVERAAKCRYDIFTGISLEGISSGTHKIEIRYVDSHLALGTVISVLGTSGLIVAWIFYPKLEKKIFRKREETAA